MPFMLRVHSLLPEALTRAIDAELEASSVQHMRTARQIRSAPPRRLRAPGRIRALLISMAMDS